MFHQGTRSSGGNIVNDIHIKIDSLLDTFIAKVQQEVDKKQIKRAIVRSLLPCSIIVVKDSLNLFIIAEKNLGMPSSLYLDHSDKLFSADQIMDAAKWEFGFDNPFLIIFPVGIINENNDNTKDNIITSIALTHIDSEFRRIEEMKNIISLNPVFGHASYNIDDRLVFTLMPFTDELTQIYNTIIKPTVERKEFNLVCKRADDIKSNKAIIQDIWKAICEARIVIADLSGLNPNVMYELGIAHTVGKETILIYQKDDNKDFKFPFDLSHIRRIEYKNDATGGKKLEIDLIDVIKSILKPDAIS